MKIVFSTKAECDLLESVDWYKKHSLTAARNLSKELKHCFHFISENPHSSQVFHSNIRVKFVIKFPYNIYYSIEEKHIVILRILHNSRDNTDI